MMQIKICSNFECRKQNVVEGYQLKTMYGEHEENKHWCKDCLVDYTKSTIKPSWDKGVPLLTDTKMEEYLEAQKDARFISAAAKEKEGYFYFQSKINYNEK